MSSPHENHFKLSNVLYKKTGSIVPGQVIVGLLKQFGEVMEAWNRSPNKEAPPMVFIPDCGRIARALKCKEPRIWATISKLEKMGLVLKSKVGKKVFLSLDFPNLETELSFFNEE